MRFLKLKIQKATQTLANSDHGSILDSKSYFHPTKYEETMIKEEDFNEVFQSSPSLDSEFSQPKKRTRKVSQEDNTQGPKCTKNIVINYGKAIVSFACSEAATAYLQREAEKEGVNSKGFRKFVIGAKEAIGGIAGLRTLLLIEDKDDLKVAAYKKMFQFISEVFIKYFSVNWIIHGRVTQKMTYLKYRFKMLRRIQNPEHFTYIRSKKMKN